MRLRTKLTGKSIFIIPIVVIMALTLVATTAGAANQAVVEVAGNGVLNAPPVPFNINYQGYLTDTGGSPIDGTLEMAFSIYSVAEGGTPVWTETHTSVVVTSGRFNVLLGSVNPINAIDLTAVSYLGVRVGADAEMTPRQRLASVAFALRAYEASNADTLDGKSSTAFVAVAGDTMTGALILPADGLVAGTDQLVLTGGRVGIGTTIPAYELDVEGTAQGTYSNGNYGRLGTSKAGVSGFSEGFDGVSGRSTTGNGVNGSSSSGYGVLGQTSSGWGVQGSNSGSSNYGSSAPVMRACTVKTKAAETMAGWAPAVTECMATAATPACTATTVAVITASSALTKRVCTAMIAAAATAGLAVAPLAWPDMAAITVCTVTAATLACTAPVAIPVYTALAKCTGYTAMATMA